MARDNHRYQHDNGGQVSLKLREPHELPTLPTTQKSTFSSKGRERQSALCASNSIDQSVWGKARKFERIVRKVSVHSQPQLKPHFDESRKVMLGTQISVSHPARLAVTIKLTILLKMYCRRQKLRKHQRYVRKHEANSTLVKVNWPSHFVPET